MTYNNVSHYCDEISRIMIFTQGTEENSTKARIYYKPEDIKGILHVVTDREKDRKMHNLKTSRL